MSHSFIDYPSSGPDQGIVKDLSPAADPGTAADAIQGSLKRLYDRSPNPAYIGQVATGCKGANNATTPNANQFNSRSPHYAREDITLMQIAWANYFGNNETGPGAVLTVEASIEFPVGTFTRVQWSGNNVLTIADGANGQLSDPISVTIPRGALFWVRTFQQCASGVPYFAKSSSALAGAEYAASGLTSKVMSGTIPLSGGATTPPVIIVAVTRRPSVWVLGDSISEGANDEFDDLSNEIGIVLRSISPFLAYTSSSIGGAGYFSFNSNSTKRRQLIAPYVTHIVSQMGFNDLALANDTLTAATILGSIETFRSLTGISGKRLWQCTITPKSTSTDSWATTTNQTAVNASERANLNKQIIAGLPGFDGFFDVAAEVESSQYSGLWRVDLGTPTQDGTHPNGVLDRMIRRSKAIDPAMIVR